MINVSSTAVAPNKEIVALQYLRGFAALIVILHHAPTAAMNWTFGVVGVDVFFVISGMVMVLSTGKLRQRASSPAVEFLRKRFLRVVPLYWLFTILVLPLYRLWHQKVTFGALWHSLLFLPYRGEGVAASRYMPILFVGWTLNYEIFFYLLFAVVLASRLSPYYLIPLLTALSLPGFFHPIQSIAFLTLLNFRLLEFASGMIFAFLYSKGLRFPTWVAVFLVLLTGVGLALGPKDSISVETYFWCPLALVFTFSVISLEPLIAARRVRILELLGDASYSIYLLHVFFVIWPIKYILRRPSFEARHLDSSPLVILTEVLAACGAGIIVHLYLETPLMRFLGIPIGGKRESKLVGSLPVPLDQKL